MVCRRSTILLAMLACLGPPLDAQVPAQGLHLASALGSHMVLQRELPIRLWGTAAPNVDVTATLDRSRVTTTTSPAGRWRLRLPPMTAGGPHQLVIHSGADTLIFDDILVGEVWLASGQSNMEWPLRDALGGARAITTARNGQIRLLRVPSRASFQPQTELKATWQRLTPEVAADFSAVAYHFARRLQETLQIPVGIIDASFSGSRIEPWIDAGQFPALIQSLDGAPRQVIETVVAMRDSFQYHGGQIVDNWNAATTRIRQVEAEALASESIRIEDEDWPQLRVPIPWRQAIESSVDGLMWLTHRVTIPPAWTGQDLALHPGSLDAADMVWYNGHRIAVTGNFSEGKLAHWNTPRVYKIPARLVGPGQATLTIQKIRWTGFGLAYTPKPDSLYATGLWGTASQPMYVSPIQQPDQRVSLDGTWRYWQDVQLPIRPDGAHQLPAMLYDGMIHPLAPMSIRGVLWYQGEANVADGSDYGPKLRALITSWRRMMEARDLRFYITQITPFRHNHPDEVAELWEAQTQIASSTDHVGMVVTNDVGDLDDIHPADKKTIGVRLARLALSREYGVIDLPVSGPVYRKVEFSNGRAVVFFDHAHGLHTRDGEPPSYFEIAGPDTVFVPARARIEGQRVVLEHPDIRQPSFVRHAWHEEAQPNLINGDGLPTGAFRTFVRYGLP